MRTNFEPEVPQLINLAPYLEMGPESTQDALQKVFAKLIEDAHYRAYNQGHRDGKEIGDNGFRKNCWLFACVVLPLLAAGVWCAMFFNGRVAVGHKMLAEEYQACKNGDAAVCARGADRLGGQEANTMRNLYFNATGKDLPTSGAKVVKNRLTTGTEYTVTFPDGKIMVYRTPSE
jgi:hypothetical protein